MSDDHGAWGGKPIISEQDWRGGTEYGGVGGIIAPADSPHYQHMSPDELLMLVHNTNPTDATDSGGLPDVPKQISK